VYATLPASQVSPHLRHFLVYVQPPLKPPLQENNCARSSQASRQVYPEESRSNREIRAACQRTRQVATSRLSDYTSPTTHCNWRSGRHSPELRRLRSGCDGDSEVFPALPLRTTFTRNFLRESRRSPSGASTGAARITTRCMRLTRLLLKKLTRLRLLWLLSPRRARSASLPDTREISRRPLSLGGALGKDRVPRYARELIPYTVPRFFSPDSTASPLPHAQLQSEAQLERRGTRASSCRDCGAWTTTSTSLPDRWIKLFIVPTIGWSTDGPSIAPPSFFVRP